MLIDLTLPITPELLKSSQNNANKALFGHIGTHFDVMDKTFPLEYTRRKGIVFDVSAVKERDIDLSDIDLNNLTENLFVAFYTGFIEQVGYGGEGYFSKHPQLSNRLIDALVAKKISLIGLDFAGIRRPGEHIPKDRFCADNGVFVIENLCNLKTLVDAGGSFTAHTYPLNCTGITGLPCRVVAEI